MTVVLNTSQAWPAWVDCSRAELFSQPGSNFFAQPCTFSAIIAVLAVYEEFDGTAT